MIAVFDEDGTCLVVTNCAAAKPGQIEAEVPRGTKPDQVWWNGTEVRESLPAVLVLPEALDVGEPAFTIKLPKGTVADVNGVRQRGKIMLAPDEVGTLHVVLRGAQSGAFSVNVQTYVERRKANYPPIGEQLDALWKAVAAQPLEAPEVLAMLEQIQAVKSANPKPETGSE